ncbi:MAG: GNAT family N-acetyltransferase, partial [Rectinemataceae bacterium]
PLNGSLAEALGGDASSAYEELFGRLSMDHPGIVEQWSYYRDAKCWLLKVSSDHTTIFWLGVYRGYFRTTFYLKPDAADAVSAARLPEASKTQYANSKGRRFHGISIDVRVGEDIGHFFTLLSIKLGGMPTRKQASIGERLSYRKAKPADMDGIRGLIREYMDSMALNLCFQGIDEELTSLPGKYSEPEGAIIVAEAGGALCGCVALKKIGEGICEMKRLFVKDAFKGKGIGRELVRRIIDEGRSKGYRFMRLDTLESMKPALALYRSFGFSETAAYVYNPLEGAVYMEKAL